MEKTCKIRENKSNLPFVQTEKRKFRLNELEVFIDVTEYLGIYGATPRELAKRMIDLDESVREAINQTLVEAEKKWMSGEAVWLSVTWFQQIAGIEIL